MFSPSEIKDLAEEALRTDINIPDEHRGALVAVVNLNKVELVSAIKVNNYWKIEIVATHEWTGNNDLGVVSKVTW